MKKFILASIFLFFGITSFAQTRIQVDVGAVFPVTESDSKYLTAGFKYDVELAYKIFYDMDIFVNAGQNIQGLKSSDATFFFTNIVMGVDYNFYITSNNIIRPSIYAGCTIVNGKNIDPKCIFSFGGKLFYARQINKNLQISAGVGYTYSKDYSPLNATLGVAYAF